MHHVVKDKKCFCYIKVINRFFVFIFNICLLTKENVYGLKKYFTYLVKWLCLGSVFQHIAVTSIYFQQPFCVLILQFCSVFSCCRHTCTFETFVHVTKANIYWKCLIFSKKSGRFVVIFWCTRPESVDLQQFWRLSRSTWVTFPLGDFTMGVCFVGHKPLPSAQHVVYACTIRNGWMKRCARMILCG